MADIWNPESIPITASELFNGCASADSNVKTLKLKGGSGYVVRAFIPLSSGRAPLWVIYSESIETIKSLLHEVGESLGSEHILFIDNYIQNTYLVHDVALWGSNGLITCHSWTQESWGKNAHIGYICGDWYRLRDEAEDVLLGITACLLGKVDAVTTKICDEAQKGMGRSIANGRHG